MWSPIHSISHGSLWEYQTGEYQIALQWKHHMLWDEITVIFKRWLFLFACQLRAINATCSARDTRLRRLFSSLILLVSTQGPKDMNKSTGWSDYFLLMTIYLYSAVVSSAKTWNFSCIFLDIYAYVFLKLLNCIYCVFGNVIVCFQ